MVSRTDNLQLENVSLYLSSRKQLKSRRLLWMVPGTILTEACAC